MRAQLPPTRPGQRDRRGRRLASAGRCHGPNRRPARRRPYLPFADSRAIVEVAGPNVALASSLLVAGVVAWQLFLAAIPGSMPSRRQSRADAAAADAAVGADAGTVQAPEKNQVAGQPGQQPKPAQESGRNPG